MKSAMLLRERSAVRGYHARRKLSRFSADDDVVKGAKVDQNRVQRAAPGKIAKGVGSSPRPLQGSSGPGPGPGPGRWLLVVLCLDLLWLGFVRLPSLSGHDPFLGRAGPEDWIPALIAILLVSAEVYLVWLMLTCQVRENLAACRTSALMDKVLSESTPWRWTADAAGRFTYCGPESVEMLGYEPSELLGRHFSIIIDPEDLADVLQERSRRTDSTGHWRGVRTIYRHRFGSRVMVDISANARTSAEGEYLGLEGLTRSLRPGTMTDTVAQETRQQVEALIETRHVSTAFQPVRSLSTGKPIGVEALTRFRGSAESPDVHFADADSVGLRADLELVALETALDAARVLPSHLYIAANLSPDVCRDPRLPDVLRHSGIPSGRIVVEVTERHAVEDYALLRRALQPLRNSGVRIAVDDAGAGFASMRHILELAPDLIKLDRDVIAGIDADPARQALATAMVVFAAGIAAQLVAEGIETPGELATITKMGIHVGQGYLLGRRSLNASDWTGWN